MYEGNFKIEFVCFLLQVSQSFARFLLWTMQTPSWFLINLRLFYNRFLYLTVSVKSLDSYNPIWQVLLLKGNMLFMKLFNLFIYVQVYVMHYYIMNKEMVECNVRT